MHLKHINNVSDIVHGTIQLSCIEKMIISTPQFNRLHKILQNSTLFLTFPCNSVKRFEHSIGTMHIAGDMFYHSLCNADDETIDAFLSELNSEMEHINTDEFCQTANSILADTTCDLDDPFWEARNTIELPYEALFSKYVPACVTKRERQFDYLAVFQAVRIVGLLHDIGHLPYSHALEKALENIYYTLKNKQAANRKPRETKYIDIFTQYFGSSSQNKVIHEEIGKRIAESVFNSITDEWKEWCDFFCSDEEKKERLENDWPIYLIGLSAFGLAKKILSDENIFFKNLHLIVDGTFDADRLDFICRDTYAASIDKHIVDYGKLISSLKLITTPTQQFQIAPFLKYVNDVESFLHKRWEINTKINYHHRAAKMYMLLIECVTELGLLNLSENAAADEKPAAKSKKSNQYLIKNDISGIWETIYNLNEHSTQRLAYLLIQLDDGWLDTVLKKEYVTRYEPPFKKHRYTPLAAKLEELISNRKNYYSLTKIDYDFSDYDDKICEHFLKSGMLNNAISLANELTLSYQTKIDSLDPKEATLKDVLTSGLSTVNKVINNLNGLKEGAGFFYRRASVPIDMLPIKDQANIELTTRLKDELKSYYKDIINDAIIVLIPAKVIASSQFLPFHSNGKLHYINKISGIMERLKADSLWTPGFYIYLSPNKGHFIEEADDTIKDRIGLVTASVLLENIVNGLEKMKEDFGFL